MMLFVCTPNMGIRRRLRTWAYVLGIGVGVGIGVVECRVVVLGIGIVLSKPLSLVGHKCPSELGARLSV